MGNESFLRPYRARPLPVVCNHSQWIWLTKSWTSRYRNRLWSDALPMIMRVPAGELAGSGILGSADALLYLDHDLVERDRDALGAFATRGGSVISSVPLAGVDATVAGDRLLWDLLPATMRPLASPMNDDGVDELDPGLEVADIRTLVPPRHTYQRYWFDVDALREVIAVLPVENAPGWTVTMDGAPASLFSTGPDLVGVLVPKGAHRLAFAWRMPARHRAMIYVSLLALAVVLLSWGAAVAGRLRGRR
jgi:hypothetical protein